MWKNSCRNAGCRSTTRPSSAGSCSTVLSSRARSSATGTQRLWSRLTSVHVRQHKVVIDLQEPNLLTQAILTLAQRVDSTAHGGDILTDGQGEAFDKRRVDLPATHGENLLHRCTVPKTTRCATRTSRRLRVVLITCAYSSPASRDSDSRHRDKSALRRPPHGDVSGAAGQVVRRRRVRRGVSVFTHGAMRALCESGQELKLVRTLTGWLEGYDEPRRCRRTLVGPSRVQHHPEPPESQDHQLVVKKVRNPDLLRMSRFGFFDHTPIVICLWVRPVNVGPLHLPPE
jgi:hypothetical protein